ncbi:MAG: acyltransferase [Ruminococcaceae bacterium]|nr:acyltransferase [Oscillospiraceae bacterium]
MCRKDLLRHRSVWMGLATVWIMLYHCPLNFGPLQFFIDLGYGGVDICIFASGIGCFYSLTANPDVGMFMKRRLKRLGPTYLLFIVIWLVYQYVIGAFGYQMAIGNLLGIQFFTGLGQDFNWYIGAIFLFYALAPYFKSVAERSSPLGKLAFVGLLLVGTVPFWNTPTLIIAVSRLPLFYVGMLFAKACQKDAAITAGHIAGLTVAFVLGAGLLAAAQHWLSAELLWNYGLYWYPFLLITPPVCVAVSYLSGLLEKTKYTKPVISFLSLCGNYSFELYLVHVFFVFFLPAVIYKFDLGGIRTWLWIGSLLPIGLGCFLLRRCAMLCSRLWEKGAPAKGET